MRLVVAIATVAAVLCGSMSAQAEKRIFIIANNSDGYGVDRCLASGESCGKPIANAYCQARDFTLAASFRKIEREEITGAVPASDASCRGNACEQFVAIECSR
jgi:hypothetical protein